MCDQHKAANAALDARYLEVARLKARAHRAESAVARILGRCDDAAGRGVLLDPDEVRAVIGTPS